MANSNGMEPEERGWRTVFLLFLPLYNYSTTCNKINVSFFLAEVVGLGTTSGGCETLTP